MKKMLPLIIFLLVSTFGYKMVTAGTLSPVAFAAISGGVMISMAFLRPKNAITAKQNPEVITNALGEFAKDAFADDSKESAAFRSATKDFLTNMPKAAIAKQAIPRCNLTFVKGAEMKAQLSGYLKVLFGYNPAAIGGAMPDDAFYYAG